MKAPPTLRKGLTQIRATVVAVNNLGRILFLPAQVLGSGQSLQQVLAIHPEIFRHITTSSLLQRSGDERMAKEHQARYLRFKADESAQAITGPYRQLI